MTEYRLVKCLRCGAKRSAIPLEDLFGEYGPACRCGEVAAEEVRWVDAVEAMELKRPRRAKREVADG